MSYLRFRDGTQLDLRYAFPKGLKTVAMAMSGGVESGILYLLLEKFYGRENVYVFSAHIDRRSWEAEKARELCQYMGVDLDHFAVVSDNFHDMSPSDNQRLMTTAKAMCNWDGWFNGANKLLFAPTAVITQERKDHIRSQRVFLPFIELLKQNTIELYYMIGREDVLAKTHSCTVNHYKDGHCGVCYCCHERARGFAVLGEQDKATYNTDWNSILKECYYSDKHVVKNW